MDRVRPLKIESISGGGSQDNVYPHDMDPNEDGVEARGLLIQNDSSDDETVVLSRDASDNMTFKDGVVVGTKTLTQLLSSEDDDQVKDIVPAGETFTVKADYQHIIFDELTIDGDYVVIGESVIIGAQKQYEENLKRLLYYIDNGPVEGFVSAHKETTGRVFPTSIIWYTDSTKAEKIVEKENTWDGVVPSQEEWTLYDTDGATPVIVVSDAITYANTIFETSRTRTITLY
jgi:hypothetical protein